MILSHSGGRRGTSHRLRIYRKPTYSLLALVFCNYCLCKSIHSVTQMLHFHLLLQVHNSMYEPSNLWKLRSFVVWLHITNINEILPLLSASPHLLATTHLLSNAYNAFQPMKVSIIERFEYINQLILDEDPLVNLKM